MTPKQENAAVEDAKEPTRFYLIFDELAKAGAAGVPEVSQEEIDEIDQIRRIVMDVTDDRPIFMTST